MSDPIDRAAEVITRAQFGLTTPMMSRNIADDLHAAGLLVTPAHDAAVAARALREAAESGFYDGDRDAPKAGYARLHRRADRIEASHE